jgi:hypothetical protein
MGFRYMCVAFRNTAFGIAQRSATSRAGFPSNAQRECDGEHSTTGLFNERLIFFHTPFPFKKLSLYPRHSGESVQVYFLTYSSVCYTLKANVANTSPRPRASAISGAVRALIRYAGQHSYEWGLKELAPVVEAEMGVGVLWGKRKEAGCKPS